jgi:hypothetical protein
MLSVYAYSSRRMLLALVQCKGREEMNLVKFTVALIPGLVAIVFSFEAAVFFRNTHNLFWLFLGDGSAIPFLVLCLALSKKWEDDLIMDRFRKKSETSSESGAKR